MLMGPTDASYVRYQIPARVDLGWFAPLKQAHGSLFWRTPPGGVTGQLLLLPLAPEGERDLQPFLLPLCPRALPLPGAVSARCPRGRPPHHLSLGVQAARLPWRWPSLAAGPGGRPSCSTRPPKSPPCEVECDRTRVTYGTANGWLTDWTGTQLSEQGHERAGCGARAQTLVVWVQSPWS